MGTPAYKRPSPRSWAGGLFKRLLARGLDPYTAKMVSRHVRADFAAWGKAYQERASDPEDVALFRSLILGRKDEARGT